MSKVRVPKEEIAGIEFKNAVWVPSADNDTDEAVFVKEIIHTTKGEMVPNIRMIENFERTFYVTKESKRKHKQKKSWEHLDNLREYRCTQRTMPEAIVKALGFGRPSGVKRLNRNPYLYGTDIATTTILKHQYLQKWGDFKSNNKVAHLDIERDVTYGTEAIQMISITMGPKIFQAITKDYIDIDQGDFVAKVRQCYQDEVVPLIEQLDNARDKKGKGKYWDKSIKHEFDLDIRVVDNEAEAVIAAFNWLHEVKPDILSIWNMPYDLDKMCIALRRFGIRPEDVFCDPGVPAKYRYFKFQEGSARILDANGDGDNKEPQDRWHRVKCPSHFYWADQMCVRRAVRKHLPKEGGYSLGAVLGRVFGMGKLKGDSGLRSSGIDWHKHMQRFEKVFYCVYNMFDNIGAQLLDEHTLDLCSTFPAQVGVSDLESYGSQGKKLYDDMYFKLLQNDQNVICGISDQMADEMDKLLVTLDGWISTLSPHLVAREMGNRVIDEYRDVLTKIVMWVLDIDVKSSYPSTGVWLNLEQQTILRQMCKILGVPLELSRRVGLNLPAGRVNAVDIMTTVCNAPSQVRMLQKFCKAKEIEL